MKLTIMKWTDPNIPTRRSRLELTRQGVTARLEAYRSSGGPTRHWESDDVIVVPWPSGRQMLAMLRTMAPENHRRTLSARQWVSDQKDQDQNRRAAEAQMRLEEHDRQGSEGPEGPVMVR